jgi:hypothetical protein
MKMKVYADRSGKILATSRPAQASKGAPSHMRIEVQGGYEHEIEVPDDLLTPQSAHRLHSEYRVDLSGSAARLIQSK